MPKIHEAKLIAEGKSFALVVSRFNDFISEKLLSGALALEIDMEIHYSLQGDPNVDC